MTTVTENYYGRDKVLTVFADGKERQLREALARFNGFSSVPEKGTMVTAKTDSSKFSRFMYTVDGTSYEDIINSDIIKMEEDGIWYGDETCITKLHEDDIEYMIKHYYDEIKDTLLSDGNEKAQAFSIPDIALKYIDDNFGVALNEENPISINNIMGKTKDNTELVSPIKIIPSDDDTVKIIVDDGSDKKDEPVKTESRQTCSALLTQTQYPFLKELQKEIEADGKFLVKYVWNNGLLKANISSVKEPDKVIDKSSITLDPAGCIVSPGVKWWPGVDHDEPVDFKEAYKYDVKHIKGFVKGESIPKSAINFTDKVGELNKIVDLRSIFAIKGMTEDTAKDIMGKIQEAVTKLRPRLEKECEGLRFTMGEYTNKSNFNLITNPSVRRFIGGEPANEEAKIQIEISGNKQAKLVK